MEIRMKKQSVGSQTNEKIQFKEGLRRIEAHFSGDVGTARLMKLASQSLGWTGKMFVLFSGAFCIDALLLSALFATTDDWTMVANALHTLTAESLSNTLHHDLLPQVCTKFVQVWVSRALAEAALIGFSSKFPNGTFGVAALAQEGTGSA